MVKKINNDELLKYAISEGIIDLSTVQEKLKMKKREELLSRHPYKIFFGTDNFWHTYLPDDTKKNNRRHVKKKEQKDIEECVIAYWKSVEKEEIESTQSLKNIFHDWIIYKSKHTKSTSYIKRITADWNKYYVPDNEFISKPIKKFTKVELDIWAHDMIKKYDLTKKQYYNMAVILRQELDYAVEMGMIQTNVFNEVKICSKVFRKVKKKDGVTQVYMTDEIPKMVKEMLRRFYNDPSNTAPLAVLLDFEIGVRIAELVAIKKSDISPDFSYIHIQRQSVRQFEYTDDTCTKMKFSKFDIVDYTKTDESDRNVYLTEVAKKIINIVLMINEKYGHECDEYLFVKGNHMLSHYSVQARVLRGCESIGIITKSMHKIRKTYISSLIDSGLNIDEIRRQAGHSDERTTYSNYCFNRLTSKETSEIIESALSYDDSYDSLGVITSNQNELMKIC